MVKTRSARGGNSSQPLGRGQAPSNLPPHPPPPIPNIFPHADHTEGGDENQPHNSAHNSASTANQDIVATQLAAMQQQFGVFQQVLAQLLTRNNPGDPLINLLNPAPPQPPTPPQNPEPVQHVPAVSESQGQSHIAPAQQPLHDDVTRHLDSLERLVVEQRGVPPPHPAVDSVPHPLNTNIVLEPYPTGFRIPQLETYDGTKDPDDHLHAFYSCMQAQNASNALMCKIFPSTLRVKQRDGESLKNFMSRFNDAVLEVNSFDQAVGITAVISGLGHERFRDSLLKHPATTFSEVNDRSLKFITVEEYALSQNITPIKNQDPDWRDENPNRKRMKTTQNRGSMSDSTLRFGRPNLAPPQQPAGKPPVNWTPFNLPRSQIFMQIKNKMDLRRPDPMRTTAATRDHTRYCDFHQDHGHTTEQCNSLRSELESLAQKGMLNEYIQRVEQPRFVMEQGTQRQRVRNPPNRQGVGYQQALPPLPPPARVIHMITGGLEAGGLSSKQRKLYVREVRHQNRAQKRKFDDAEWKNQPITFTSADLEAVVTPHNDPLVTSVTINNCEVQRVLVDTGSAPDIMYFHCFESLGLDPALLQRYDGPIYGFNNQPVPVEGVLTMNVAFGSGRSYVTPSVRFLVVKMASSFNVVIGQPTLTEIRAVVSQSHLCMKFPTPTGIATLRGNQEVARHCYITSVTQPQKGKAQTPEINPKRIPDDRQVMGVEIVDNRPEDETKAAPVEDVEEVQIDDKDPSRKTQIGTKLNPEERAELIAFLRANKDVFAWTSADMPGIPTSVFQHKFSTNPLKKPVTQKRRLFGGERLKVIKEEFEKLLQAGFIRRVDYCEWVANPMLVKKANGKWRMCIDYTNLNDACPKDCYPMPNIDKLVEAASGNERLSLLDAYSGYHQVPMAPEDEEKTSFYAGDEIYCYVMMPFGLKNAGATYRRCSPPLLTKAKDGEILYLYLGISDEAISLVLVREEAKQQKPIYYISSVLHGAELRYPIAEKAALVVVTSARKLRPYFQSHLIIILTDQPLRQILQKPECSGRLIKWAVELGEFEITFQQRSAIRAQALADFIVECTPGNSIPTPEPSEWTLYIDGASSSKGSGAGALLISPDGYRSEHALKFNFDATNNMAEYEALLLCLQLALELKLSTIQVSSDSQLVVNQINSICEVVDPVMVKYVALVAELKCRFQKFCLSKIPRTENEQADSLSKFTSDSSSHSRSVFVEVLDEPSFMKPRVMEISTDPGTPSWTDPILSFLRDGIVPEDKQEAMKMRRKASRYTLVDGVLYKRSFSLPLLRCLNPYEVEYALREVHEGVCGSHVGARTLAHKVLRQGYYWPNMYKDATHFVQRCSKCQFFAHLTHQPAEELTTLVAPWPFAQWGLDLLGPFVKGVGGVTHLIVGVDYFTKYGIPNQIVADNGPQFNCTSFRDFCSNYGIKLQFTSVYHPESNGMVESVNKCILEGIKPRLEQHKAKWAYELNNVLWAYRTTSRTATGETPYHLAFGTEAVIPIEIGVPSFRVTHFDERRNGQLLRENLDLLDDLRKEARLRTLVYKQKIANFYNKRVQPRSFKVGDLVLRKAGLTGFETRFGKLAPNWEGPYTVAEVPHPGAYILQDTEGKRVPRVWNINNLKKFYP
ncbi:hypothetical protein SLEP1_g54937 [Rubroshorea leprosula]|uniref:RNA-directed DNA polymerase n=1 Tax=Rubroshorea leprosula TaxID=152421 RepID=A0AAV5MH26_9ROSI|nr:hypothetical protein SLEP1_g54937 [Rubroshorea leprosula]